MANQEDSACEIPLKRPRLDGTDCDGPPSQDGTLVDTCENKDTATPDKLGGPIVGTACSYPSARAPSEMTETDSMKVNDGSSSEEVDITTGENSDNSDNLSDLSGMSEDAWKPIAAGPLSWVQRQMSEGQNPRDILRELVTADAVISPDLDDFTLWQIIINLMSEPPKRKKLHNINTLDDVLELMRTCKKIMVLTGAGVSVSCGIPDFRSRNGIYARLAVDFPDLPDPQAMFDIRYFQNDPRPFFKFAKEIYPGQFEPSRCHKFIQLIEQHGKLLRNYTQNIDTLEQVAGIRNVIQCHGSFAGATCMVCRHKVTAEDVKEDIFNQIIPRCPVCPMDSSMSILKPDIVFFGESLPDEFHRQMAEDKDECDLLIVIGSSLKVRPVALIPNSLPSSVPQVLINREPLSHMNFDVELLGDCDCIISELCKRLGPGWSNLADKTPPLIQIRRTELATPPSLSAVMSGVDLTQDTCEKDTDSAVTSENTILQQSSPCLSNNAGVDSVTTCVDTDVKTSVVADVNSAVVADIDKVATEVKALIAADGKTSSVSEVSTLNATDVKTSVVVDVKTSVVADIDKVATEVKALIAADGKTSSISEVSTLNATDVKTLVLADVNTSDILDVDTSVVTDVKPPVAAYAQTSVAESDSNSFARDSLEVSHKSNTIEICKDVSGKAESEVTVTRNESELTEQTQTQTESGGRVISPSKAHIDIVTGEEATVTEEDKELYGALDTSLQEMQKMWHIHERESVAKRLQDDQFLFLPPCRYVFHGAEVMSIEEESEESDQDSLVSESRDLHTSQCGEDTVEGENGKPHPHTTSGNTETTTDIKLFETTGITDVGKEACT
ncbi:NAD-dependent protein deacetylase sirtuin-1-like isoform X1 [Haliotis rufescens]|uniref:NAD-dependent protein deacetylase sirtuin-1-like isoform X1 n=1 Tax=Haliotis rufescens TaxID=6454 RepID=UPI00201F86C6|nr:NAD-dependent protein deacetylase sirtuin-1-like isoform X1 [Haliotis rufescens]